MSKCKGMSLLEMLISLGLFSFMFVFIIQFVRQNQRQVRKINQELSQNSSFDHVIDLIKKDFNSISFLFDLNSNFSQNFPVEKNQEALQAPSVRTAPKPAASPQSLSVFMSPYFVFKGQEDEVEFVSYSLRESSEEDLDLKQWIQIRYFIQDCPSLNESSPSSCLMRAVKKYWGFTEERPVEETLVLFRGFKSLKFSYLKGSGSFNQDWEDRWELERAVVFPETSLEFPQELPFPFRVRLEMETQKEEFVWSFNVADSLLNSWNPFSKEFFNFTKWEPAKKPKLRNRIGRAAQ